MIQMQLEDEEIYVKQLTEYIRNIKRKGRSIKGYSIW